MEIIPALSIKDGRVVGTVNESYVYLKNETGKYRKLSNILKELKESYEAVYVLDIDGIERNAPDLSLIQETSPIIPIWFDAAPITTMGVMDILVAGASEVIISTKRMRQLTLLEEALELSENVVFSIDYDNVIVSPNPEIAGMGVRVLASSVSELGIKTAVFFDLCRLRSRIQLNKDSIKELVEVIDKVYVAGVIEKDEIEELESLGASGVIVDFKILREWFGNE